VLARISADMRSARWGRNPVIIQNKLGKEFIRRRQSRVGAVDGLSLHCGSIGLSRRALEASRTQFRNGRIPEIVGLELPALARPPLG
jgi:hypothetical protein